MPSLSIINLAYTLVSSLRKFYVSSTYRNILRIKFKQLLYVQFYSLVTVHEFLEGL